MFLNHPTQCRGPQGHYCIDTSFTTTRDIKHASDTTSLTPVSQPERHHVRTQNSVSSIVEIKETRALAIILLRIRNREN